MRYRTFLPLMILLAAAQLSLAGCSDDEGGSGDDNDMTDATDTTDIGGGGDTDATGPTCGNGLIETGEDCDGNALGGMSCEDVATGFSGGTLSCGDDCAFDTSACLMTGTCGDGVVDSGEDCDDEGASATCDADCSEAACGDATLNTLAGEQCDDGNTMSGDGCSAACENETPATCGDGAVDAGEDCDDAGASATCDADCTDATCGDDTLNTEAGEQCDDGNTADGDGCSATCQTETSATCGDGAVDAGEDCDDTGESATCDADCTDAVCGDDTLNATAGEVCDDGNADTEDCDYGQMSCTVCAADCTEQAGATSYCGDSAVDVDAGEQCDDGNTIDGDGCSATCQTETSAACGDGAVDAGEDCDDAGESATCDADCTSAACGDTTVNAAAGETCDDGNADTEDCLYGAMSCTVCAADCTEQAGATSYCGDSVVDGSFGEQCDDGNTIDGDGCSAFCLTETPVTCGDGAVDAGEDCDDAGESATCDANCTAVACGDGTLNATAGEACDDADTTDADGCDADCTVSFAWTCDVSADPSSCTPPPSLGAVGVGDTASATGGPLPAGESVFYSITVNETGELNGTVSGTTGDVDVYVYAPDGTLLFSFEADGDEVIEGLAALPGDYIIEIHAYVFGGDVDSYTIDLTHDAAGGLLVHPPVGGVIFSEVMPDPSVLSDNDGEWFEVHNTSATDTYDLSGCTFESDSGGAPESFVVPAGVQVAPQGYVTFARTTTPGFAPDHDYTGEPFNLANTSDAVRLLCPLGVGLDTEIDAAAWDENAGTFGSRGVSLSVDPDFLGAAFNNQPSDWCGSTSVYNDGVDDDDYGTPGAANDPCVFPRGVDFCRLQFPTTITDEVGTVVTVYGRLYMGGWTDLNTAGNDPHPLVLGSVGYGPDGTTPDTWLDWTPADPNPGWPGAGGPSNDDEYQADLTLPAPGDYDVAYRFSGDGGATWTYCDTVDQAYDVAEAGALTSTPSSAPIPQLIFSEYIEGSGNNKAFEVYNAGADAADLSGCAIEIYTNGSATAGTTLVPIATLAAGDAYVVCNGGFSNLALCDETSSVANYNGDDRLMLICGGVVLDVFGDTTDPGSAWSGGGVSTVNQTLRRKCGITTGDTDPAPTFDPSVEWDTFPQDTFDGLGAHDPTCP